MDVSGSAGPSGAHVIAHEIRSSLIAGSRNLPKRLSIHTTTLPIPRPPQEGHQSTPGRNGRQPPASAGTAQVARAGRARDAVLSAAPLRPASPSHSFNFSLRAPASARLECIVTERPPGIHAAAEHRPVEVDLRLVPELWQIPSDRSSSRSTEVSARRASPKGIPGRSSCSGE